VPVEARPGSPIPPILLDLPDLDDVAPDTLPGRAPVDDRDPEQRLRLRCVACEVLARPVYACAARSRNVVDVVLLRRGLHDRPGTLLARLEDEVRETGPEYDAVVLASGICGGAAAGIRAGRVPLVVPRALDCRTVLLGDRRRFRDEERAHPRTYWYAPDYVERLDDASPSPIGLLGIGADADEDLRSAYAEYVDSFGKANADTLTEALGSWRHHYADAAFLDSGVGDASAAEGAARDEAARRGLGFRRVAADLSLLQRLLDADWGDDVLVLRPGQRLVLSMDERIVAADEPRPRDA